MTEICQTLLKVSVAYGQERIQGDKMRGARIIENVRTKCIILGEALRTRVKKFKQNLSENYSKSTKIAITACKFSKIFRSSMLQDPPRDFSVSQSASNLFCRKKKIRLKKMWKLCPSPFSKFLATLLAGSCAHCPTI